MKHIKSFNESNSRKVELKSKRNGKTITFDVIDGRITNIKNQSGAQFRYKEGEPYNRGIETWCSNNEFTMDGKDMGPEEKIMGIKKSDIPANHPLRMIYPNKFRK